MSYAVSRRTWLDAAKRPSFAGFGAAGSDRLEYGESLGPGESIVSADGRFRLTFQPDGNLVLTQLPSKILWLSNTNAPGSRFYNNGDLVIRLDSFTTDGDGNPVWAPTYVWQALGYEPGTEPDNGPLIVQSDGNMTMGRAWSSGTWGAQINPIALGPLNQPAPTPETVNPTYLPGTEAPSPDGDTLAALAQGDARFKVADEGQGFTLQSESDVAYGAGTRFLFRRIAAGSYSCSNAFFVADPANGTRKACYVTSFRPTPAAPSPTDAQIAYVIRRWAGHKLWEVPYEDRVRLARISDLSHESGKEFPRGAPISPVFLRVHQDQLIDTSLIRRDDGERARDAKIDHDLWFSPAAQDWYLVPVRTIYQQDWGTFGIEGFHIENNVSAIASIVGSVVGTVLPGIGTAVGAVLIAAGKIVQPMIQTHEQAQTGKAAQGVIVGTVADLMKFAPEDLLYSPSTTPPDQIQTPAPPAVDYSNILLYGGLGIIALALLLRK